MKFTLKFSALVLFVLMAAGCGAQIPPNPTVISCAVATAPSYTPLNQNSPVTVLTYETAALPPGTYCFIVQGEIAPNYSDPSNVAMVTTTAADPYVLLTWTAPTTGTAPAGYVLSQATAVQSTLNPPVMGGASATATASIVKKNSNQELALNLKARAVKR